MIKPNDSIKKLAAYSTIASALLTAPIVANASLYVYNVDPDSTMLNPQDTSGFYSININNGGDLRDHIIDFSFKLSNYSNESYASNDGQLLKLTVITSTMKPTV